MTALSEKTKQIYEQRLNFLRELFPTEDRKWMANHAKVIETIEGLDKSVNTKKLFYITLKSTLRDMPRKSKALKDAEKAYEDKMVSYNRHVNENMMEQMKDTRESEQWIDWNDVIKARDKAISEASTLEEFQDAVILGLYTFIPPARLDFAPMHIFDENDSTEPKGNLLSVGKKKMHFIFKEYKTAQRYGRKVIEVPKKLMNLINEWLEMNPLDDVLLINSKGEPMTEVQLGVRLKHILSRLTGKPAGVNILRHSYISHIRKGDKPYKQQKAIADAMFHSVDMNQLYRKM